MYEPSSDLSEKRKSSRHTENERIRILLERQKELTGCEQSRRDKFLLQEELSEQNRDLRETRIKSLHDMEYMQKESSRITSR